MHLTNKSLIIPRHK